MDPKFDILDQDLHLAPKWKGNNLIITQKVAILRYKENKKYEILKLQKCSFFLFYVLKYMPNLDPDPKLSKSRVQIQKNGCQGSQNCRNLHKSNTALIPTIYKENVLSEPKFLPADTEQNK